MPSRPFPILFHVSAQHFQIRSWAKGRPRCAEGRIRPNDPEWGFLSSTVAVRVEPRKNSPQIFSVLHSSLHVCMQTHHCGTFETALSVVTHFCLCHLCAKSTQQHVAVNTNPTTRQTLVQGAFLGCLQHTSPSHFPPVCLGFTAFGSTAIKQSGTPVWSSNAFVSKSNSCCVCAWMSGGSIKKANLYIAIAILPKNAFCVDFVPQLLGAILCHHILERVNKCITSNTALLRLAFTTQQFFGHSSSQVAWTPGSSLK